MRLIIIGFGNVGRSFLKMIGEKKKKGSNKFNSDLKAVAVLDRKGGAVDPNGIDPEELLKIDAKEGTVAAASNIGQLGLSPLSAIKEIEADTILELTPTNPVNGEPAITYIKAAIKEGKNVVTTNKGPPALAMRTIVDLASQNNVDFRFSGTVGGGTPILEFVRQTVEVDEVLSLKAILNGTTNYILSKMYDEEIQMSEALKQAQLMGYAEKDPSLDINGIDPALKLTIIANYALKREFDFKDIRTIGITGVNLEKIRKDKKEKRKVKLICTIKKDAIIAPQSIEISDPVCVDGSLNSIQLKTKHMGEVTLIGPGAGGYQTATSILGDLLAIEGTSYYLKQSTIPNVHEALS
ncbi:homoserine dehydrogenase [Thermoproteota archaeon]